METVLPDDRSDFLHHKGKQKKTAATKKNIMGLEETLELERLLVLHDMLNAEDNGQVGRQRGDDGAVGGQRSDAFDIRVEMDGQTVRNRVQYKL